MATILLAEDDADIRLLVTLKLTQAGHQVRGFGNGLSAAADAREHPPDLAVLDIMMPGMTGLEVCRELRKDPATARIPVILLTALARETDITAGLAAGADDYIVKPFSPREFTIRVNAVLARVQAGALPRHRRHRGEIMTVRPSFSSRAGMTGVLAGSSGGQIRSRFRSNRGCPVR